MSLLTFLNNVRVLRVPEIVYQPSMLGIEQAGIAETIDFILNHYTAHLQTALVQVPHDY